MKLSYLGFKRTTPPTHPVTGWWTWPGLQLQKQPDSSSFSSTDWGDSSWTIVDSAASTGQQCPDQLHLSDRVCVLCCPTSDDPPSVPDCLLMMWIRLPVWTNLQHKLDYMNVLICLLIIPHWSLFWLVPDSYTETCRLNGLIILSQRTIFMIRYDECSVTWAILNWHNFISSQLQTSTYRW